MVSNHFTKIPDSFRDDLITGNLTKDEFLILSFLWLCADKNTGIVITNSRLLGMQLDIERERVHSILKSLKRKKRIQSAARGNPELNQKRGNTKPYPVFLPGYFILPKKTRVYPEVPQTTPRDTPRDTPRENIVELPQSIATVGFSENGTALAKDKIRSAADIDKERGSVRGPDPVTRTGEGEGKISFSSAAEKTWKGISEELRTENNKSGGDIVYIICDRRFIADPQKYGTSTGDCHELAAFLSTRLDVENGWKLFDTFDRLPEKPDNPMGWLRSMAAKRGKEWSR